MEPAAAPPLGHGGFAWGRALAPGLLLLLLPPLLLWPLPLQATTALTTSPQAEGVSHLWGWWAALREGHPLAMHTALLARPEGVDAALIDPLLLLPYALGAALGGPAMGFNLVLLTGLWVSGLAGLCLARRAAPGLAAALLGVVVGCSVPGLLAIGVDGITEGLGVGWVGLQLALLLSLAERVTVARLLALGGCLVAAVYSGPYNAVWTALIDLPVGIWLLGRTRAHLLPAALAVLASLPAASAALSRGGAAPGTAGRLAPEMPMPTALWRGAWREGADLLDLLVPAPLTGHVAEAPTTAYLGLGLVLLALLGARGRRPWLIGAAAFAALALGPFLTFEGRAIGGEGWTLLGPAGLLERLPIFAPLTRWYRAGAVAVLLLIPPAAAAVSRLRPAWAGLALGLLLLDARFGAPLPGRMPTYPLPEGSVLIGLEGPFAELPPIHPLHRPGEPADQNLLLQVLHGQPTNATLNNEPKPATVHPALRGLRRAAEGAGEDEAALDRVRADARAMAALGYRGLVVYKARLRWSGGASLRAALGAPVAEDELVVVYVLGDAGSG